MIVEISCCLSKHLFVYLSQPEGLGQGKCSVAGKVARTPPLEDEGEIFGHPPSPPASLMML